MRSQQPTGHPTGQRPRPTARLAYGELDSPAGMRDDCAAVDTHLPRARALARAAARPAPSVHFEDYPREVAKRDIGIEEAAARLARALHLELE
jgi:hypothetical protein